MKEKIFEFVKKHKYRLLLLVVIILYTILSFFKLGNTKNPQTWVNIKNNEYLVFKMDKSMNAYKFRFFTGNRPTTVSCYFTLDTDYNNMDGWKQGYQCIADYANVLKWNEYYFTDIANYDYLIVYSNEDTSVIGEMQLYDEAGNVIKLEALDEKGQLLLDEQETVPDNYSYMNSTYFDEVYFPRTVYEIMNNESIYEYTHPPLGKLIMSIPVFFMGLTPFSYRLVGNICGILMIWVIYEIVLAMFKKGKYALFAAIIMALDGMHFAQTRIGTVDSYLVLFCMISFLFFYKYLTLDRDTAFKQKMLSLVISGTFWGMAISVKWTAFFFGAGLGVLWLYEALFKNVFKRNGKFSLWNILWSVVGFVFIPGCIYVASYIPIANNPNSQLYVSPREGESGEGEYVRIHDPESFIKYQKGMYYYHSELQIRKKKNNEEDHAFSSKWYTWPIIKRPLWFYVSRFYNPDGSLDKYGTIACMGNPAIWWLGIGTSLITAIYSLIKRNREGLIITVMIMATWLTYAFIDREMFIYHYFITLPFVMLTIVFALSRLIEWKNSFKILLPILCTIFLGFFIYFYPVYSGIPVEQSYIKETRWFKTWYY